MSSGLGDAVGKTLAGFAIVCVISVPLAVWKSIEIAVWIYHHVHVHFGVSP